MQTYDYDSPSVSLVSWARTVQPVRPRTLFKPDPATDTVLFGCSAVALILAPFAVVLVVLFG